jgi:hypothetical protein
VSALVCGRRLIELVISRPGKDGGDVAPGPAGLQQSLLLLPLSAGALPSARQTVQEDHRRYLPAVTGMAESCILLFVSLSFLILALFLQFGENSAILVW